MIKYDGYQMLWAFDTSAVQKEDDGGIDAACISTAYGNGGYCAGLTWKGTGSFQEEKWAEWMV